MFDLKITVVYYIIQNNKINLRNFHLLFLNIIKIFKKNKLCCLTEFKKHKIISN